MAIIEFVRARFNDDEATARSAMAHDDEGFHVQAHPEVFEHINTRDPARVLSDLVSKRMIVDGIVAINGEPTPPEALILGDQVIWELAQPYAEHPDFQSDWRP